MDSFYLPPTPASTPTLLDPATWSVSTPMSTSTYPQPRSAFEHLRLSQGLPGYSCVPQPLYLLQSRLICPVDLHLLSCIEVHSSTELGTALFHSSMSIGTDLGTLLMLIMLGSVPIFFVLVVARHCVTIW